MTDKPVEWCQCTGSKPTYAGLGFKEAIDGSGVPWVHSSCRKPTFGVWQRFEQYCWECGRTFSSPYTNYCEKCSSERPWPSWAWGIAHDEQCKPWKKESTTRPFVVDSAASVSHNGERARNRPAHQVQVLTPGERNE